MRPAKLGAVGSHKTTANVRTNVAGEPNGCHAQTVNTAPAASVAANGGSQRGLAFAWVTGPPYKAEGAAPPMLNR
jgi:hypothetical protein